MYTGMAFVQSQELEKQWIFSSLLTLFPFSSFPVWLILAQFRKLMVISFAYNHFYNVSGEGCVRNILERPGLFLRAPLSACDWQEGYWKDSGGRVTQREVNYQCWKGPAAEMGLLFQMGLRFWLSSCFSSSPDVMCWGWSNGLWMLDKPQLCRHGTPKGVRTCRLSSFWCLLWLWDGLKIPYRYQHN